MLLKTWTKKVSIVEASQSIQLMQGTEEEESGEEGHEGHNHSHELDPHVWLDPVLAQKVTAIRDALIKNILRKSRI